MIDVCRHYQRGPQLVKAVNQVNLTFKRGELTALVGTSGAGKSTLLNLLAGLDRPSAGQIIFEGTDLASLSRRQLARYRAERVGIIFQTFNLIPHLTALRNVELALYFDDMTPVKRHSRAIEILSQLGLSDRLDHKPADLSGGEQQRVAIARALVKNPDLILADEPTGNLDRDNAAAISDILKELNRGGLTIIMITHAPELARRTANRLVRMDYGGIVGDEIIAASGEESGL